MTKPSKVLLLNASNMETFPVFPYAFIQISAIARRAGIEVISKDLLGILPTDWAETAQELVAQHEPAMILITLRNTDSLGANDYQPRDSQNGTPPPYFPIEQTKILIAAIRTVTNLKVVVGGFGFSVFPDQLMQYLRPDFGVFGGPDEFFTHFNVIQNGQLDQVTNLLYFDNENLVVNPRSFFPPFAGLEYTSALIEAMLTFYEEYPEPGLHGAAVEIVRGCPHTCVFCSEPLVKGYEVQYRDLDYVMQDIALLVEHGISKIYIVSSELNPGGNQFILELADRIQIFNDSQPLERKITWFGANYLLGFSAKEYERLYASGFTGGWFDLTALDDENARAMRTPYRNRTVIENLKIRNKAKRKYQAETTDEDKKNLPLHWTMFLGNPATTVTTIRNTLHTANEAKIPQLYDGCGLNPHIRVFDYEGPDAATLAVTYSVDTKLKRIPYNQLKPSFAYPPALLKDFSEMEIVELFKHIGETYLSTGYTTTRDWLAFLNEHTSKDELANWLAELSALTATPLPEDVDVEGLFTYWPPEDDLRETYAKQAWQVVEFVLTVCLAVFPEFFTTASLPDTVADLAETTPYAMAQVIFSHADSEETFTKYLMTYVESYSPEWQCQSLLFSARAMLYKFNILLNPKYRGLFLLG